MDGSKYFALLNYELLIGASVPPRTIVTIDTQPDAGIVAKKFKNFFSIDSIFTIFDHQS